MTITYQVRIDKPDTATGFGVTLTTSYRSYDNKEIEKLSQKLIDTYDGLVIDTEVEKWARR